MSTGVFLEASHVRYRRVSYSFRNCKMYVYIEQSNINTLEAVETLQITYGGNRGKDLVLARDRWTQCTHLSDLSDQNSNCTAE